MFSTVGTASISTGSLLRILTPKRWNFSETLWLLTIRRQ